MRIGELATRAGVTTKAVRYYESIGVLPEPARTPSGYRTYGEADAERLAFVRAAQRYGLTLDEVREVIALRDRGEPPCAYVATVLQRQVGEIEGRMAEMARLRDDLARLLASAPEAPARYCPVIEHAGPGGFGPI